MADGGVRIARRYLISGRVQGVGFRYFTQAAAFREGVHGWVRNLPDGRVEAAAEGEAEAIERFERDIRHGPPGARVERMEVDDSVPDARETGFILK
jgi:acylphosphatase